VCKISEYKTIIVEKNKLEFKKVWLDNSIINLRKIPMLDATFLARWRSFLLVETWKRVCGIGWWLSTSRWWINSIRQWSWQRLMFKIASGGTLTTLSGALTEVTSSPFNWLCPTVLRLQQVVSTLMINLGTYSCFLREF